MRGIQRRLKLLSVISLLALTVPLFTACSEEDFPHTPDAPGAFLFDHEWEYIETRIELGAGGSLPFPSDRAILEKIRYPEGGAPPTGDALYGSDVVFEVGGQLLVRPPDFEDFEDFGTNFRVVDDRLLRASIRKSIWFKYEYSFDESNGTLIISPEENAGAKVTGLLNDILARILFSGALDSVAAKVTEVLFEDPRVADAISNFLYEGIRGRLEELPGQEPEDIARAIASAVSDLLQDKDFESALESAIALRLEELTDLDPEEIAGDMAAEIIARLEFLFSEEKIYEAILPRLESLADRDPAEVSSELAVIVYDLLSQVLTEERLSAVVESVWTKFVEVGEEQIAEVASELATVLQDNWLNAESLSALVLPSVEKLGGANSGEIAALTDEIVAKLKVLTDELNQRFPELGLDPNWVVVQATVRAGLTAASLVIDEVGAQEAADTLGQLLADTFFTHEQLQGVAQKALFALQEIEPTEAGAVLGSWLVGLLDAKEEELVEKLSERLEVLIEQMDAERAAEQIAAVLSEAITSRLNEEALYDLLLPLLEKITELDPEAGAAFLVDLLKNANLLPPDFVEEKLFELLLPILEELLPLDKDELAEKLVELIVESDLVNGAITPERVENLLKFALYRRVLEKGQNLAAMDHIEIELQVPE